MRKVINTIPTYSMLPIIIEIANEIHVVKHKIHEKSFRKNLTKNDFEKDLLTNRYSI
jgi:hypothetical protein